MADQQQATAPELALEKYSEQDAASVGLPSPGAMNLLRIFAKQMQGTPFFPKGLGDNPGTIMAVVLTGREMGLDPMQSLRGFYLSPDGRLGMYADAMLSIMRKRGEFKFEWLRTDDDACEVKATRPDGEAYTSRFSVEDAKRAGLLDRDRSAWKKYPRNMCRWRCISDIFRTLGSDLGGSQMYDKEEILDMEEDHPVRGAAAGVEARSEHALFTVGRKTPPTEPPPETITVEAEPQPEPEPLVSRSGQTEPLPPERLADPPTPIVVPESEPPEPEARQAGPASELPTVAPTATVQPTIPDRMRAALKALGDDRRAQTILNAYFKAWFNRPSLPKDSNEYAEAMADLEADIRDNQEQLRATPQLMGGAAAAKRRRASMFDSYPSWSEATKLAAKDLIAARSYTGDQFGDWAKAVGLDKMNDEDALAFIAISQYTRSSYRLVEIADAGGYKISSAISMLKKSLKGADVSKLTEEEWEAAIKAIEPESMQNQTLPFEG